MSTRGIRAASAAVLAAEAAFVFLVIPAMRAYPGGTAWDPATSGHDFWLNYLCDLTRRVALNGQPNPAGAALAQGAMGLLALGLLPFWWVLPQLFPSGARLGALVRALGSIAAAGALAVVFMPSDRFADLHGVAIVLAAVPGLTATLLSVFALAREEPAPRVAAAVGVAMLLTASVDFALYVGQPGGADPGPVAVAVLERVSALLLLAWMGAVAWRARSQPRPCPASWRRDSSERPGPRSCSRRNSFIRTAGVTSHTLPCCLPHSCVRKPAHFERGLRPSHSGAARARAVQGLRPSAGGGRCATSRSLRS